MNKIVILSIVLLVIFIIIICIYFISRHKQKAIQVFTFESFINAYHLNDDGSQNKGIIDSINDFFDDVDD
ncbi:hypothetical protein [Cytobacillus solani]|uniref:hypothetical protein n=1 Tax=Cytobacillus solani TaxID=1637975 RepID=UPI000A6CB3E7|nr:hypothetical protein [Cytobacillus solani]